MVRGHIEQGNTTKQRHLGFTPSPYGSGRKWISSVACMEHQNTTKMSRKWCYFRVSEMMVFVEMSLVYKNDDISRSLRFSTNVDTSRECRHSSQTTHFVENVQHVQQVEHVDIFCKSTMVGHWSADGKCRAFRDSRTKMKLCRDRSQWVFVRWCLDSRMWKFTTSR